MASVMIDNDLLLNICNFLDRPSDRPVYLSQVGCTSESFHYKAANCLWDLFSLRFMAMSVIEGGYWA